MYGVPQAKQLQFDRESLLKLYDQFSSLVQAVLPLMDEVESTLEKLRSTPVENEELNKKLEAIKVRQIWLYVAAEKVLSQVTVMF